MIAPKQPWYKAMPFFQDAWKKVRDFGMEFWQYGLYRVKEDKRYRLSEGFFTHDELGSTIDRKIELDFCHFNGWAFAAGCEVEINDVKRESARDEQGESGLYKVIVKGEFISFPSQFGSPFREDEKVSIEPFIARFDQDGSFPKDFTFSLRTDRERIRDSKKKDEGYGFSFSFPNLAIFRSTENTYISYSRSSGTEIEIPEDNPAMLIICQYLTNIFGSVLKETPKEFQELVRSVGATENRSESLEERLEKLFPNVPPYVMEELLRDTFQELDANISSLEKEVALDSFGSSYSDAVGKIRLKSILGSPTYIIKIIKDKAIAEKEILVATEAAKALPLALYVPRVFGESPISYKGYSLIVMEDIAGHNIPHDEHKQEAYRALEKKEKRLSEHLLHRLYVASLFHTHLRHLTENPLFFSMNVPQYENPEELRQRLGAYLYPQRVNEIVIPSHYNDIVGELKEQTNDLEHIVHNDMRNPNWIGERIIDFGSCSRSDKGGGIYRDIVRIILAEKDPRTLQAEYIQRVVDCYYRFRDFEEQEKREPRDMKSEYRRTFAELYVEAPRHMLITCLHHRIGEWQEEIAWYHAVQVFAEKEI